MRKLTLTIATGALLLAGTAFAQPGPMGDGPPNGPETREQAAAKAKAMFERLDANHDGVLNAADRKAHEAEVFSKLDTDGNGQLSLEEFTNRPDHPDGDRRGGKRMGKRGAGQREHGPRMGQGGPGGPEGMLLARADTNGDGAISEDEFVSAMLARFDQADTNHDGTVTPDERKAARDAMRDKFKQARADRSGWQEPAQQQ